MRNTSGHRCKEKMNGSEKKSEREHARHFLHKQIFKVSRCSRSKQRGRNVQKKCGARAKCFLPHKITFVFHPFSGVVFAA